MPEKSKVQKHSGLWRPNAREKKILGEFFLDLPEKRPHKE